MAKNIFPTHSSGYNAHANSIASETTSPIAFESSILTGNLLCDGIGDLISIENELTEQAIPLAYKILKSKSTSLKLNSLPAPVVDAHSLTSKRHPTHRAKPTTSKASPSPSWVASSTALEKWLMVTSATSEGPDKINLYIGKPALITTSPLTKRSSASSTSSNKKANV